MEAMSKFGEIAVSDGIPPPAFPFKGDGGSGDDDWFVLPFLARVSDGGDGPGDLGLGFEKRVVHATISISLRTWAIAWASSV